MTTARDALTDAKLLAKAIVVATGKAGAPVAVNAALILAAAQEEGYAAGLADADDAGLLREALAPLVRWFEEQNTCGHLDDSEYAMLEAARAAMGPPSGSPAPTGDRRHD